MDYSLLTEQQLQKRYYSLSRKIRDVLDSENNLKIIHQICRAHQLNDDEKILIVEQLVGLILLGFVSADDLSLEISENIHLNRRHSDDIAFEINRKIFAPIWSEIEKNYSPVSEGEGEEKIQYQEIQPPETKLQYGEVESPQISIPIEIRKPEPPIRIIGFEEEKKIEEIQLETVAPELSAEAEGPMIIHKETELKPLSESKKSFKSLGGLFGFLKKKKEEEKPIRAEIEGAGFSKEIKEIIKEFKPIETKIKVVDYTEVPDVLTNDQRPTTDDKTITYNLQPTTDNLQHTESPIKIIEEEKPIEESEIIASKTEIQSEEVKLLKEIQPKKRFLSGLTKLFRRKKEDKKDISLPEEPPIKIVDSIRGTPEFIEAVEADKHRIAGITNDQRPTTDDKQIIDNQNEQV